jgi:hypothetical protein
LLEIPLHNAAASVSATARKAPSPSARLRTSHRQPV